MEAATPRRTYSSIGIDCPERALPHKGTIQLLFRGRCLAWLPVSLSLAHEAPTAGRVPFFQPRNVAG